MAEVIEVPFKDGTVLFATLGSSGPEAYGGGPTVMRISETLDQILDQVREIGAALAARLSDQRFSSAEATFGVTFTGKGQFIVAEASAQAAITIKITFKGTENETR